MGELPSYQFYRDSGVSWLGKIPEHWGISKLKYLSSTVNGATPSSSVPQYWDGKLVWITPIDLGNLDSSYISESSRKITDKGLNSCGAEITPENSVVLSTRAPIGHAAITSIPSCTNQGCKTVVPNVNLISPPFLYYFLCSSKEFLQALGKGTTFRELSSNELKSLEMALPPLSEQQRIATFLDQKIAEIDEAIDKKQRLIELLQEQKAILINQAVTKGLNPNVPMRDSGVGWIGEIPKHWEANRISWLFWEKDETDYPDLPLLVVSLNTGVTLRDMGDENHRQVASDYKIYKRALSGDISFNKMRMWQGAVGVVPENGLVSPDYVVARPIVEMNVYYFEYLFRTEQCKAEFLRKSHGIVMDRNRLYWEDFKSIYVPQPPKREQDEICEYIQGLSEETAKVADATNKEIATLEEYKSVLISNAVTGKIKV